MSSYISKRENMPSTNIAHPVFSTGCEMSYLRRTSQLFIFMPLTFPVAAV